MPLTCAVDDSDTLGWLLGRLLGTTRCVDLPVTLSRVLGAVRSCDVLVYCNASAVFRCSSWTPQIRERRDVWRRNQHRRIGDGTASETAVASPTAPSATETIHKSIKHLCPTAVRDSGRRIRPRVSQRACKAASQKQTVSVSGCCAISKTISSDPRVARIRLFCRPSGSRMIRNAGASLGLLFVVC